jgi:hypothetical protein
MSQNMSEKSKESAELEVAEPKVLSSEELESRHIQGPPTYWGYEGHSGYRPNSLRETIASVDGCPQRVKPSTSTKLP